TSGPRRTRSVTAASAARRLNASHGPRSGRPSSRYSRWSPTQTESKPAASAARAIVAYSDHPTTRSTSGSWRPTRSGRTRPLLELDDAADDLALLARLESLVYFRQVDAAGDHPFQVELPSLPELQQPV